MYFIKLENHDCDEYEDKYMKIRFNSNESVPIEQELKLHNVVIIIRSAFHDNKKYYPQLVLQKILSTISFVRLFV